VGRGTGIIAADYPPFMLESAVGVKPSNRSRKAVTLDTRHCPQGKERRNEFS
jgi:hypothetical protein